jgi:hypothetical protein
VVSRCPYYGEFLPQILAFNNRPAVLITSIYREIKNKIFKLLFCNIARVSQEGLSSILQVVLNDGLDLPEVAKYKMQWYVKTQVHLDTLIPVACMK